MESVKQLAKKANSLQPVDRLKLVEAILYSLVKSDNEIEEAWAIEAESRYQA